jgi:hypothetical protein
VNFYWGDSPMSWLRYMSLESYRRFHPDEPITLHVGAVTGKTWETGEAGPEQYAGYDWRENLTEIGVTVKAYAPPIPLPPPQANDMCRWDVLASGGRWADMDVLFTASLPPIEGDMISCRDGVLRVGLTSGAPGGVFADVRAMALDGYDPARYQSLGTEAVYALAFGRRVTPEEAFGRDTLGALEAVTGKHVADLPTEWVQPFEPEELHEQEELPECYGLHWFGGHPQSNEAARTMTPENWRSYPGAIRLALERVL